MDILYIYEQSVHDRIPSSVSSFLSGELLIESQYNINIHFHYRCISMGTCTLMIRHLKKLKTLKFPKFVYTELERFMYM